jgi:cysteine synthase
MIRSGFLGTIGQTPLVRLEMLSRLTGSEILGKAEWLNPGGSVKDRAALAICEAALRSGKLKKGGTIVEGTAGNTGIGLAHVARALGCRATIVMPNNLAPEKTALLEALGAKVHHVPALPFADQGNYYHVARRMAEEQGAFWADQFENPANASAHAEHTGPEILAQAGTLDGFVCASGTGGTIGGVTSFLKGKDARTTCYLVDCEGSSLAGYIKTGSFDASGSSIMEGIGIRRITANFARAKLDGAFLATDREAVAMMHLMLEQEGLFLGGSAALNCVGAVKLARILGRGKRIVTILCDGGGRYQSRLWNPAWLKEKKLPTSAPTDLSFVL